MEMNNINNKYEENGTDPTSELSPEEERTRAEGIALIFNDRAGSNNDVLDKANNIDSGVNGTASPLPGDPPVTNSVDMRSEFGITSAASMPDINIYQNKKTVAQGMMDIALFSANANQLRYVLENVTNTYYYAGVTLISISLIMQVLVGVGLLLNTQYRVTCPIQIYIANRINNFTIVGIFLVTVINVFICAFGVAGGGGPAAAVGTILLTNRLGEFDEDMNSTTIPTSFE